MTEEELKTIGDYVANKVLTELVKKENPLLTKKEVVQMLKIGFGTLNKMIEDGLMLTTVGNSTRILKSNLMKYLETKSY